jgi:hypothetical protein
MLSGVAGNMFPGPPGRECYPLMGGAVTTVAAGTLPNLGPQTVPYVGARTVHTVGRRKNPPGGENCTHSGVGKLQGRGHCTHRGVGSVPKRGLGLYSTAIGDSTHRVAWYVPTGRAGTVPPLAGGECTPGVDGKIPTGNVEFIRRWVGSVTAAERKMYTLAVLESSGRGLHPAGWPGIYPPGDGNVHDGRGKYPLLLGIYPERRGQHPPGGDIPARGAGSVHAWGRAFYPQERDEDCSCRVARNITAGVGNVPGVAGKATAGGKARVQIGTGSLCAGRNCTRRGGLYPKRGGICTHRGWRGFTQRVAATLLNVGLGLYTPEGGEFNHRLEECLPSGAGTVPSWEAGKVPN